MQSLIAPIVSQHTAEDRYPHIYLNEAAQAKQEEICKKVRQTLSKEHPETTGMLFFIFHVSLLETY